MRVGASAAGVAAVASVAVMVALVVAYFAWMPTQPPGSTVRVFGLVSSMGAGTHPTRLSFVDAKSGQVLSAAVSEGSFSIQLPNHRTYNVTMGWGGNYSWQAGSSDLGQVVVDMSEGSMMAQSYNVVQPVPDSTVAVAGTIAWQMVTAQPTAIKFTASDGETFQTAVSGLAFSAMLPNMMTYQVQVQATNSTGYSDWFYFHPIEVNAGVNVVGITVRL